MESHARDTHPSLSVYTWKRHSLSRSTPSLSSYTQYGSREAEWRGQCGISLSKGPKVDLSNLLPPRGVELENCKMFPCLSHVSGNVWVRARGPKGASMSGQKCYNSKDEKGSGCLINYEYVGMLTTENQRELYSSQLVTAYAMENVFMLLILSKDRWQCSTRKYFKLCGYIFQITFFFFFYLSESIFHNHLSTLLCVLEGWIVWSTSSGFLTSGIQGSLFSWNTGTRLKGREWDWGTFLLFPCLWDYFSHLTEDHCFCKGILSIILFVSRFQ